MTNTYTLTTGSGLWNHFLNDPFFIGFQPNVQTWSNLSNQGNYPPYNLIKIDEDNYMVELALAGFKKEDISVEQEKNVLTIKGSSESLEENSYIHKGIGARSFTRTFSLSEFMEVAGVMMADGVLKVLVVRNVPEEAKPKSFDILDSFTPEETVFPGKSRPLSSKKKK